MKNISILLLLNYFTIIILSSCNNFKYSRDSNADYLKLSQEKKIRLCKSNLENSKLNVSKKFNIELPENSIFYIITDNQILNSLSFKKFINFPIIVRFSDRKVSYSGNRFQDGGLNQDQVGRTYNYGNYSGEGISRDVQIYDTDYETNSFKRWELGLTTNSLGGYEVYSFGDMEQYPGIPGYLNGLSDFLEYLGGVADKISFKKINLSSNKNYFFYSNGKYSNDFNGIYLTPRPGRNLNSEPFDTQSLPADTSAASVEFSPSNDSN